jgi:hypothetical protein
MIRSLYQELSCPTQVAIGICDNIEGSKKKEGVVSLA